MEAIITVRGNVGADVELFTGDGWHIARFRLATTPRIKRGDDWVDGPTTWVTVRATKRLAANVAASVKKGDPLVVFGRLRTHTWQNSDGVAQDRLVLEADAIGHDLARGTSTFVRPQRPNRDEPVVFDDESFDPETGEVHLVEEPVEDEEAVPAGV